jgi:hypothetical protein
MKVYNKGYMNNNFIDENLFIKKAKAIAINYLGFENMQQGLEVIFHSPENKNILKPIEILLTGSLLLTPTLMKQKIFCPVSSKIILMTSLK